MKIMNPYFSKNTWKASAYSFSFLFFVFTCFSACKKDALDPLSLAKVQTKEISSITHSAARSGGLISDLNGNPIIRKGVCWSLKPNPTTADSFSLNEEKTLDFEVALRNLEYSSTYYARAFAVNVNGTSYGDEFSFQTKELPTYTVGQRGPSGGYIFYDKGEYSDFWRYLEAAPANWYDEDGDPSVKWGCYGTFLDADKTAIGTGKWNTEKIVKSCIELNYASKLCVDYSFEKDAIVYADWFLPSKDELNEMYLQLKLNDLNGLEDNYYWSSSENTPLIAWLQGYHDGLQYKNLFRFNVIKVRPIRAF